MNKNEMRFRLEEMRAKANLMEAHIFELDYPGTGNVRCMKAYMQDVWHSIDKMQAALEAAEKD